MGAFCTYPHEVVCDCVDTVHQPVNINQLDGNDSCSDSTLSSVDFEPFYDTDDDKSDISLDGSTISSYDDHSDNIDERYIDVVANIQFTDNPDIDDFPPWYDHYHKPNQIRRPVRQTVRRDNKLMKTNSLPIIAVSNLRSLMPKVKTFTDDVHQRQIGLALLSEVWEKNKQEKT